MILGWFRGLYDWVLRWGESRYGLWVLFFCAFLESIFFPIPPDPILVGLCLSKPLKSFYYGMICTLGSVLGGIVGYGLGWGFWGLFQDFFYEYIPGFNEGVFEEVKAKYDLYNFWIVFVGGFTPIPYKVITITAGLFGVNFLIFMVGSILSRGVRFFLLGWSIWKYGDRMKGLIDRYFNLLTVIFLILLVGFYFIFKWI